MGQGKGLLLVGFGAAVVVLGGIYILNRKDAGTTMQIVAPISPAAVIDSTPQTPPTPTSVKVSEQNLEQADVSTRQRFFDDRIKESPPALLRQLLLTSAKTDETTLALLREAFITTLAASSRSESSAWANQFADALRDKSVPPAIRIALAHDLAESATVGGLEALLQVATDPSFSDQEMRAEICDAIGSVGGHRRDNGEYPADLSPVLETAFSRVAAVPGSDPALFSATARAIGQVGTVPGARMLILALSRPDLDGSQAAIKQSIYHIRNPAAIPALQEPIQQAMRSTAPQFTDPKLESSGVALVHIGGEKAVRPLLDWLQQAPPEAQPLAAVWFEQLREPISSNLVSDYVKTGTFRSPEIRATLERQLQATTPEDL